MKLIYWALAILFSVAECCFSAASPPVSLKRNVPHLTFSDVLIMATPPEVSFEFHEGSYRTFAKFFSHVPIKSLSTKDIRLFNVTPFSVIFTSEDLTRVRDELALNDVSVPVGKSVSMYSLLAIDGHILQSILLIDNRSDVLPIPFAALDMERVRDRKQNFLRKYIEPIRGIYTELLRRASCSPDPSHYRPLSSVAHLGATDFESLVGHHIDQRRSRDVAKEVASLINGVLPKSGELDSAKKKFLLAKTLYILNSKVADDPSHSELLRKSDCEMLEVLLPYLSFNKDNYNVMLAMVLGLSQTDLQNRLKDYKKDPPALSASPRGGAGAPASPSVSIRRVRGMSVSDTDEERAEYIKGELETFDHISAKFLLTCPPSKELIFRLIIAEKRKRIEDRTGE